MTKPDLAALRAALAEARATGPDTHPGPEPKPLTPRERARP
jgi:hypothetical protein